MGAAKEVDLSFFYRNFNYIFMYGVIGTFMSFFGLFCFLFLFAELFNFESLSHTNRELTSSVTIGHTHGH